MRVTFVSVTEKRSISNECGSCQHSYTLEISGIGQGTQSALNAHGTAERRAKRDLEADFERVSSVTPCPQCNQRDPRAVRLWWRPHLLWGLGLSAAVTMLGVLMSLNLRSSDQAAAQWICFATFVVFALGIVGNAAFKWKAIQQRIDIQTSVKDGGLEPVS